MKVILEWDGGDTIEDYRKFERALDSKDEDFDILDSIYWELDYGDGQSYHRTEHGNIIIKQQF